MKGRRRTLLRPGYALAMALLVSMASPDSAQLSDYRPLLIFEGHVTEEFTGAPIAGAQIDYAFPATAVTDSTGRYRIEAPYRGAFLSLSAVRPGFHPETREQQISCDFGASRGEVPTCEVGFDFEMRRVEMEPAGSPNCTIRGVVLWRDSRSPVAALIRVDGTEIWGLQEPDGTYVLPEVPAGLHRVTARSLSSFALSRLVVVQCASPEEGPELPLLLSPTWIP
jgi:hypothetical protein